MVFTNKIIDNNENDGSMYILPEWITSIKNTHYIDYPRSRLLNTDE
jgi:hypothetical protein